MAICIGCGSWADSEYVGLLYPPAFPPNLRLCGYAMWFDYVEVNATYYALPKREAVERWIEQTPASFLFDIRMPRAISQSPAKAGKDGKLVDILLRSLESLIEAKKFGTFLLVLSPFFTPERHRLEELDTLIERMQPHSLAVELRHADWVSSQFRASTLRFFRERKLTWVAVDMPRIKGSNLMPPVDEVTDSRLAYLRLHGRNPRYLKAKSAAERHVYMYPEKELQELLIRISRLFCSCSAPKLPDELITTADDIYLRFHGTNRWYRHDYTPAELAVWVERIQASSAKRVWAYFNNDWDEFAIKNARCLLRQLGKCSQ